MDTQSSPTPRSRGNVAYSRPSTARTKLSGKNYAVACVGIPRHFRALRRSATPTPMLPRPTRAHCLGYIMRVVRYGRGYAGGIWGGGLYTPRWGVEMGLCTHLEFQDRYSYGLWPGALDMF